MEMAHQRGQELPPPQPKELVLDIGAGESGLSPHGGLLLFASSQDFVVPIASS